MGKLKCVKCGSSGPAEWARGDVCPVCGAVGLVKVAMPMENTAEALKERIGKK